jgi:hypothetical protein
MTVQKRLIVLVVFAFGNYLVPVKANYLTQSNGTKLRLYEPKSALLLLLT